MKKIKLYFSILIMAFILAACNNFGKKVQKGHIEVFYKDGILEKEALKTAELLYNVDMTVKNQIVKKSLQLCKQNDTVCLRMVVSDDRFYSVGDEAFIALSNYVSDSVFNSLPVNLELTNNRFITKKSLHYRKLTY